MEQYLADLVNTILKPETKISETDNLFEYGLNSIKLMKIISILKKEQIAVTFKEMMLSPCLKSWTALCCEKKQETDSIVLTELPVSDENKPFEMTPMQKAYLWGRQENQPLGGISCHAYVEFSSVQALDVEKLENAWKQLIANHPQLHTRYCSDGTQQEIPAEQIQNSFAVYDLTNVTPQEQEKKLLEIRQERSHKLLDVENGQVIELAVCLLKNNEIRLCLDMDLLVADVISFKIVMDDLADLYCGTYVPDTSNWNFRNYIAITTEKNRMNYLEDKAYWEQRISDIQAGSALPLRERPESLTHASYQRYGFELTNQEYAALKTIAAKKQTTIAMILLTLYSNIISRYSGEKSLLMNIPLFNRDSTVLGTDRAVADFTTLTLLDIHLNKKLSFWEQVKQIQEHFYECYQHHTFDGIEVQKLLSAKSSSAIIAPLVFSCTEGVEQFSHKCISVFGKPEYIITQTPQVYIDFQIFQVDENLRCIWDVPKQLFEPAMICEMFSTLEKSVHLLISDSAHFKMEKAFAEFLHLPDTSSFEDRTVAYGHLYDGFYQQVQSHPEKIALIDAEQNISLTYLQCGKRVSLMANQLRNIGVGIGDRVAVTVTRGMHEIITILAVLSCGACYVPITPNQPEERRNLAFSTMKIRYAVFDKQSECQISPISGVKTIMFQEGECETLFTPVSVPSDSVAYIILTSGTTGTPKGVEITHCAALNTIHDINKRLSCTSDDNVLAVSSIDFDLSVYDIFGTFTFGGTLIVIPQKYYRDAVFWLKAVQQYQVTLWNSVPLLFDMLLTEAENANQSLPLRAVMLSGDWIMSELYHRMCQKTVNCRFIGMGGATEASIWSNWYEVTSDSDLRGKYIPYGWALQNQAYRIVNAYGEDCPHYAVGELWIGGKGLAVGYCEDPQKTADKFLTDGNSRWYRTGDKGFFAADDCIIFLGRIDQQCKVRGHRIEVGEIEKHLEEYLKPCPVICFPAGNGEVFNHLEACVITKEPISETVLDSALAYLRKRLPAYMIPTVIHTCDEMPLSSNGKIDRKKIAALTKSSVQKHEENQITEETPTADTETLQKLKKLWCENLNTDHAELEDNYYFSGGDSLKAIRFSSEISKTFEIQISTAEVLEAQTLEGILLKILNICKQS